MNVRYYKQITNGLLIIIIITLSSCSAGYHLKRSKRHLLIAESKGANIKQDTVFKEIVLKVPGVKVEFTPKPLIVNDTLYFERDRVITKVLVKNVPGKTNTVYVTTDCPDARIESKVPITVNQKITAKKGIGWEWLLICYIAGIVTWMLWPIIRKLIIHV
jgi:hypothetical protein